MDPEIDAPAEPESNSDEAATDTAESNSEEQSDGTDESEGEAEAEGDGESEGESEADTESEDGEQAVEASADEEDPEYRNLIDKFKHITNPRDRNAAIGKAYWEKVRYDAKLRKENEALKARIARAEPDEKPKDEPPPPAPADLEKVTKKIEALYQRDQQAQTRHQEIIKDLNAADRELAIAEDRLKDVSDDDDRRPVALARVRTAKLELEAAKDRYSRILDTREQFNDRMEQLLAEKDWIERFHKDQTQRQNTEQQRHEQFRVEFPQQVDTLSKQAAAHLELKLDDRLHESLWRHVNRALQADIRGQYLDVPVEEIPVPDMVLAYTKEWAEDRDLAKRKTFTEDSRKKLAVTKPTAKPGDRKAPGAPAKPAVPASMRPAVPAALLAHDSTPAMAKARKALVERFR